MPSVDILIHGTPQAVYDALPQLESLGASPRWKTFRVHEVSVTFFPARKDPAPSVTDAL